MYVIKRTDQSGGWVMPPGSHESYTSKLQHARKFPTRESAERERCPGNETIQRLEDAR